MCDSKTYSVIHQTEFYPVDSIIHSSNNWGLYFEKTGDINAEY